MQADFMRMPLYQQVRDSLVARIQAGKWRAGQAIPNESDLGREYNVSNGTMRKALDLMEFQRIVIRKQGRGTFICDQLEYDTPSENATMTLTAIGATVVANGTKIRLSSGKTVDAHGLRALTDGIFDVAAWLEARLPTKPASAKHAA